MSGIRQNNAGTVIIGIYEEAKSGSVAPHSFHGRLNNIMLETTPLSDALPSFSPVDRALDWIRNHELTSGGISFGSKEPVAYPEVTGYLVPTLLYYGEKNMATRCIRWLIDMQQIDGSYLGPYPEEGPYLFDAGQVLRGLLATINLVPGAEDAARRTAEYIYSQWIEGGRGGFPTRYEGKVQEAVHWYVLPPLVTAADLFHKPEYRVAAERCIEFYLNEKDTLNVSSLTHFLAYELEALIDLNRADLAAPILTRLLEQQADDGSVRARKGIPWVCAPGLAQIAICWYKLGQWEAGDKAVAWLEKHQQPSGGFLGSYGPQADYYPDAELSWVNKFYLDAHRLRIASSGGQYNDGFPVELSSAGPLTENLTANLTMHESQRRNWDTDFASWPLIQHYQANQEFSTEFATRITQFLTPGSKVLEVGSRGGWQSLALARTDKYEVSLLDSSPDALTHASQMYKLEQVSAQFIKDDLFNLGTPDFDLVFNTGTLEHLTLEKQVTFLRAMASRSREYVVVVVPNKSCYWYWLWRIHSAGIGLWPYGKETPVADMSAAFESAGLRLLGQTFLGAAWTETFIQHLPGLDQTVRHEILEIHRSRLDIPEDQKSYLVAFLGTVDSSMDASLPIWSKSAVAEESQQAEMNASLADALALKISSENSNAALKAQLDDQNQRLADLAAHEAEHYVEIDQLVAERGQLVAERGQLVAEHSQLVAEHSQLAAEFGQLVAEFGQLVTERGQLVTERDQLAAEHSQLVAEFGQLVTERGQLAERLSTFYRSKAGRMTMFYWRWRNQGLKGFLKAMALGIGLVLFSPFLLLYLFGHAIYHLIIPQRIRAAFWELRWLLLHGHSQTVG